MVHTIGVESPNNGRIEMISRLRSMTGIVTGWKALWTVLSCLIVLIPACGKDRGEKIKASRMAYASLVDEVLETYTELHPLRSSHLGLHQSDSLLFTFSSDECERSVRRLEKLHENLKKLTVGHLAEREIANSTIMLHWLKGELFAFKTLHYESWSPLLYCWIIEEALYGIPSRPEPPYQGELAAYEKRLSQIPLLLQNATALLEHVHRLHRNVARGRLSRLIDRFDELEGMVTERYGERIDLLDSVKNAIMDFRNSLTNNHLQQNRGIRILGLEHLSRIFLYDDVLELEPNRFLGNPSDNRAAKNHTVFEIHHISVLNQRLFIDEQLLDSFDVAEAVLEQLSVFVLEYEGFPGLFLDDNPCHG